MTYALDTNIVSYFIQHNKDIAVKLREILEDGHEVVIPPAVYYEIRRGFKFKSAPKKEQTFNRICNLCVIGEMSLATWEQAADIYANVRRQGKTIEDADILIAAFCVVNGYTLITNNVKHFENVGGLNVENWVE
jgi:predicted nucleic acid-binding protein